MKWAAPGWRRRTRAAQVVSSSRRQVAACCSKRRSGRGASDHGPVEVVCAACLSSRVPDHLDAGRAHRRCASNTVWRRPVLAIMPVAGPKAASPGGLVQSLWKRRQASALRPATWPCLRAVLAWAPDFVPPVDHVGGACLRLHRRVRPVRQPGSAARHPSWLRCSARVYSAMRWPAPRLSTGGGMAPFWNSLQ